MKKIMLLCCTVLFLFSCFQKEEEAVSIGDPVQDSITAANMRKVAEADSLARVHQTFTGMHQHGKDLAKHAHQNLPKKRRLRKKAAAVQQDRIKAQQRAEEMRKARIERYLGKKEADTINTKGE